jgi:two-component system copper resistance phosphate regulon response regulator CusR
MKILIVEDEPKVGKALSEGLKANGDEITLAQTGEDGFFLASSQSFDLIVLDVMLPGRNGIEVLKTLRKQGLGIPVLLLTAKDSIEDRVLLRRGKTESIVSLKLGTLEMDLTTRVVTRDAKAIELTVREFELLEFLLRNKGRVVSREMLARDVWKENNRATPLDNVIDVHIARLRRKVDDEFEPKLVRTIRGVGFMLSEVER